MKYGFSLGPANASGPGFQLPMVWNATVAIGISSSVMWVQALGATDRVGDRFPPAAANSRANQRLALATHDAAIGRSRAVASWKP